MLFIFSSGPFYTTYVNLPNANTPPHKKYIAATRCATCRAIDSSHISCTPLPTKCTMYCNHKGFLSQNCLFVCSFNLKFVFGYTGWEGSAMDNQVWEAALEYGLNIPGSHYFLVDAGYTDGPQL